MPRQCLPKRMKRRADFLRLAAKGRKTVRPGFVLQALQSAVAAEPVPVAAGTPEVRLVTGGAPEVRVGFTATKKIGNAVIRNRAKRRLREAARLVLAEHTCVGAELVLVARRETGTMDFATLRRNLTQAVDEVLP